MELNTEEYFLLLFAFNLTMALLLHLSEIHTLPHIYIFFCWPFDSLLLSPSSSYLPFLMLSSLHLPFLFPQSLWSPVFPAYHLFYLLLFPESYFLLTPFLPFPYFCSSNQSPTPYHACKLILHLLPSPALAFLLSLCQIHADPRIALCFPHSLSLFSFLHSQFDIFGAESLRRTHEGGSIPAP